MAKNRPLNISAQPIHSECLSQQYSLLALMQSEEVLAGVKPNI
jgi:hypothetical protein